MNISTRLDVFQECFFMHDNKLFGGRVLSIKIIVSAKQTVPPTSTETKVLYMVKPLRAKHGSKDVDPLTTLEVNEEGCFATKEDLLRWL